MKGMEPEKRRFFFVFRQAASILILSLLLGVLVNQVRRDGIPWVEDRSPEARLVSASGESLIISLEEARDLCLEDKVTFLDARPPDLYDQGHIRCAWNIPWQSFEKYFEKVVDGIPLERWVVTYCDGEHCYLGEDLAKELMALGYENVRVLLNGWTRWLQGNLPIKGLPRTGWEGKTPTG